MADVRALLKAKRQEARITHPLASYNQSGQLRCAACGTLVKHASAWEGHLGSKIHRTTVARLKEQERAKEEQRIREEMEEQERIVKGKRKAAEDEDEDMAEPEETSIPTKKQRVNDPSKEFPADFFSDPSRSLPENEHDSEEEETTNAPAPPTGAASAVDLEWERFQREVVNASDYRDTYENATIAAEPVMASEVPEGFPTQENVLEPQAPNKMDELEARRQKEQEERELIMDRLLDEERAQEEADMKVIAMKTKLELLKKKREAARATRTKPDS